MFTIDCEIVHAPDGLVLSFFSSLGRFGKDFWSGGHIHSLVDLDGFVRQLERTDMSIC